jgi:hypothetical protein
MLKQYINVAMKQANYTLLANPKVGDLLPTFYIIVIMGKN